MVSITILEVVLKSQAKNKGLIKEWIKIVKNDLIVAFGGLEPMRIMGSSALHMLDLMEIDFFGERK